MNKDILIHYIDELFPTLVSIRRDFHQHPELGFKEIRTNQRICEFLDQWGIEYESGIAKTGVVAIVKGSKKGHGNCIGIRADMDAIPIQEQNDIPYKSLNDGVMHACGHDAHTTMLLGTANLLHHFKNQWSGSVKFFFQPDEEGDGGAKPMIDEGCLTQPDVDFVIGHHVMPHIKAGQVELRYNQLNASSDIIEIELHGKASHGAYPHQSIDAITMAAQVISAIQTIVSRNTAPTDSLVITLGTINGGDKYNNVADKVLITGTLRSLNEDVRSFAKKRIQTIVESIATANMGKGITKFIEGYPVLNNNNQVVEVIESVCSDLLGKENIVFKELPSLGVDDFAYFTLASKAAYYHLGCGNPEKGIIEGLHNNLFNIDEDCMKTGVLLHTKIVEALLTKE